MYFTYSQASQGGKTSLTRKVSKALSASLHERICETRQLKAAMTYGGGLYSELSRIQTNLVSAISFVRINAKCHVTLKYYNTDSV